MSADPRRRRRVTPPDPPPADPLLPVVGVFHPLGFDPEPVADGSFPRAAEETKPPQAPGG